MNVLERVLLFALVQLPAEAMFSMLTTKLTVPIVTHLNGLAMKICLMRNQIMYMWKQSAHDTYSLIAGVKKSSITINLQKNATKVPTGQYLSILPFINVCINMLWTLVSRSLQQYWRHRALTSALIELNIQAYLTQQRRKWDDCHSLALRLLFSYYAIYWGASRRTTRSWMALWRFWVDVLFTLIIDFFYFRKCV